MRALVTNDDGIHAPGLRVLRERLARDWDVRVVAPDRERSAVAHGITLHQPLRIFTVDLDNGHPGISVSGTPADCVKLAVLELLDFRPDIVFSGINPGPNVGVNLNYSGTVSAAREAAILGIPAIAVSVCSPEARHFEAAAECAALLGAKVLEHGLPRGTFLNVNVPDGDRGEIRGVKISRQGGARLEEAFHKRFDPRNLVYYWQGSETHLFGEDPEEDGVAVREGYISVTPVRCDMTEYALLEDLASWEIGW
jgi:5'-nucleotidase